MTPDEQRSVFVSLRTQARDSLAKRGKAQGEVDSFIAKHAKSYGETPFAWISGARAACFWAMKLELANIPDDHVEECGDCAGSGVYWLSRSTNGPCYRCQGKGNQTKQDQCRNRWYDAIGRRL